MFNREKVTLVDGLAYCEIKEVSTTDPKTGGPLTSKASGALMIKICWSVVDKIGQMANVYDYITCADNTAFKIRNLENAIGVEGIYDRGVGKFNPRLLMNKSCGAVIKQDDNPDYGSKILKYVPLSFYETIQKGEEPAKPKGTAAPKIQAAPMQELQRDDLGEDDDIPF